MYRQMLLSHAFEMKYGWEDNIVVKTSLERRVSS